MSIRVLIVDDSAVVRALLTQELSCHAGIEVVGVAPDPYIARNKIIALQPDVITLDIEMPRMDGITFLKKLMHYYPLPVVVFSSLTPSGGERAFEALQAGAVEVVTKPSAHNSRGEFSLELLDKIKTAARISVSRRKPGSTPEIQPLRFAARRSQIHTIVAMGASTGGTQAIQQILCAMPANAPGFVIVQHMPEHFTNAFAKRLDSLCKMDVREAKHGDCIKQGSVLIAPGHSHMLVQGHGDELWVEVKPGPLVQRHRPSVDVLFKSIACTKSKAIGVLLTGMGKDGAQGLKLMKQQGAITIAQDEESSVVFGMAREAHTLGAVDHLIALDSIGQKILDLSP